ncbi:MAG: LytR C-terminal domain-containing protein, partial [Egibacteraceae bacterium]
PGAAAAAPEETRVQILDGVNDPARLAELVAALEALGYQVVATNPASTAYAATTVFYSEGQESAAQALQTRDPRMAVLRPASGLSDTVDLHIVLGADWAP